MIRQLLDHTIMVCIQLIDQYERYQYKERTTNRLLEQIYMDKLRQLDGLERIQKELGQKQFSIQTEELDDNKKRQPLLDCLVEEIEYINELQTVFNLLDQHPQFAEYTCGILQMQHVIIYKLMCIKDLEKAL